VKTYNDIESTVFCKIPTQTVKQLNFWKMILSQHTIAVGHRKLIVKC